MRFGPERRHFQRYDVDDVRGRLAVRTELEILNLSLTGLAAVGRVAVPPGERRTITLAAADGGEIVLEAVSQRCVLRDVASRQYEIGFDFTHDLGGKAPKILRFLEAHIVVDVDRRVAGRFELAHHDRIAMRELFDFEVRRISRTGMLVETPLLVVEENDVLDLHLDTEELPLETRVRVASVQRDTHIDSDRATRLGLEFLDLDDRQIGDLSRFIRELID